MAHPERTLGVMDHVVPVRPGGGWTPRAMVDPSADCQLLCTGIPCLPYGDPRQGIVHVVGPELGLTRPGLTVVCGDSHTSTHGALGAIAFGIGTTQVAHVLATQSLLADRPKTMQVQITGTLAPGVTSKDLALALIAGHGNRGGSGYAVEFRGDTVGALSIEARMTLCNMGIEFGSRMNIVAPDETTLSLRTRPARPGGSGMPLSRHGPRCAPMMAPGSTGR